MSRRTCGRAFCVFEINLALTGGSNSRSRSVSMVFVHGRPLLIDVISRKCVRLGKSVPSSRVIAHVVAACALAAPSRLTWRCIVPRPPAMRLAAPKTWRPAIVRRALSAACMRGIAHKARKGSCRIASGHVGGSLYLPAPAARRACCGDTANVLPVL